MDIKVKYIMFVHRNGFIILQKRFNDNNICEVNNYGEENKALFGGLIGGFFSAFSCVVDEFKKSKLLSTDSKVGEIWFNGTMCKVLFEKLYKIITLVDCKKTVENVERIEEFLIEVKNKFNEKYASILAEWNRDMDRFNDFNFTIEELVETL